MEMLSGVVVITVPTTPLVMMAPVNKVQSRKVLLPPVMLNIVGTRNSTPAPVGSV